MFYGKAILFLLIVKMAAQTSNLGSNQKTTFSPTDNNKMSKTALVLVADGSEEMEFVITVDILRRAKIDVTTASVKSTQPHVECSKGIKIIPDLKLEEAIKKGTYDIVVLPGGLKGAETFAKDENVGKLLQKYEKEGKKVAAICAAPTALKQHGVFKETRLTSYPSFKDELSAGGYPYSDENVVVSGNLITSRGPSTAFDFALQIVETLQGADTATSVAKGLLYSRKK